MPKVSKLSLVGLTKCFIGLLAAASLTSGTCAWSQETGASQNGRMSAANNGGPLDSYKEAWRIVKENFYDETFNGQDWSRWEHKFDEQIEDWDDAYLAISTMIASLGDKNSGFLNKDAFSEEKGQIVARFFGVGIQIGLTPRRQIEIGAPIPRTPAYHAGLQSGDIIVAINHKPAPPSVEEAVKLIRGPRNTAVTLTIERDHKRRDFTISRDDIPVYCVFDARMLDNEVGYIRIDTLIHLNTVDDIVENLSRIKQSKGLIIDLRGNPGGLQSNALDVATLFLEDGVITHVADRHRNTEVRVEKQRLRQPFSKSGARESLPLYKQPLVVLIDGSTRAATEVLVGALKDNRRAELVGQKTYGMGKVGSVFSLLGGVGINLQ